MTRFHRKCGWEIGVRLWLQLPLYAFGRLALAPRLLGPLLRHPLAALGNLRHWLVRQRDDFNGRCLGVPSREAFVAHVAGLARRWAAGELAERPRLWVFQAYCEKPHAGACRPAPGSPYTRAGAQRRFNEFCVFADRPGAGSCGGPGGACRVGEWLGELPRSGNVEVELKIMLDERQMADYWAEMLRHQARTGQVIPFLMDVCPLALWLAEASLFRLKTPLGIVFHFDSPNRCRDFRQYRAADGGCKAAAEPVALGAETRRAKAELLAKLREAVASPKLNRESGCP
jgi:hypothetical protein